MSNELKVTGGDWRAEPAGDEWLILSDSNECIETVYTGEANAHLLAASKRLYEALNNTLSLAVCKWGNLDPDANKVFESAFAALAAARGEDQ